MSRGEAISNPEIAREAARILSHMTGDACRVVRLSNRKYCISRLDATGKEVGYVAEKKEGGYAVASPKRPGKARRQTLFRRKGSVL